MSKSPTGRSDRKSKYKAHKKLYKKAPRSKGVVWVLKANLDGVPEPVYMYGTTKREMQETAKRIEYQVSTTEELFEGDTTSNRRIDFTIWCQQIVHKEG